MFSYVAYGLRIHSALPLPELVAGEAAATASEADVIIRFGRIKAVPFETNGTGRHIHAQEEEVYLFWQRIGMFLVRGEREIIIDPAAGVEERVLRLFTLGTTLGGFARQYRCNIWPGRSICRGSGYGQVNNSRRPPRAGAQSAG